MPTAVYRGPQPRLRLKSTGARLTRGTPTRVTHREGWILAESSADVDVDGLVDFDAFTVPELQRLCRQGGISTDGVKAELIDRLEDTTLEAAPDGTL